MVHFSAVVILFSSLAAFATPLASRTLAQVEVSIATVNTDVTSLGQELASFPATGGKLSQALIIHTGAVKLAVALVQCTAAVKSIGTVGEADGTTILKSVQAIEPTIISALNGIVTKKSAFEALPLGGVPALVKADLNTLNTDATELGAVLIAAAPTALKSQAAAIKAAIDAAFATAIAAYAKV